MVDPIKDIEKIIYNISINKAALDIVLLLSK
jgi:hypothetical protein